MSLNHKAHEFTPFQHYDHCTGTFLHAAQASSEASKPLVTRAVDRVLYANIVRFALRLATDVVRATSAPAASPHPALLLQPALWLDWSSSPSRPYHPPCAAALDAAHAAWHAARPRHPPRARVRLHRHRLG